VSPSWRDHVDAYVGTATVRVAVQPAGWRRRGAPVLREVPAADGAAGPADALAQALGAALDGQARRGCSVHVAVSNHHVRYAVVEQARLLRSAAEREAAAVHALRSVYGDSTADWHIAIEDATGDTALVAGIPRQLLDGLRAACTQAGARAVTIQPVFVSAVNDALAAIDDATGWVAVLEGGRVVVGTISPAGITAVRSQRVSGTPGDHIASMVQRARLLDGTATLQPTLLLASEHPTPLAFGPDSDLRLRQVPLRCALGPDAGAS
jgi:osmotically-inducible protein OsmY